MRFVFALIIIFPAIPIHATTIHVPADSSAIQAGINGATEGDTVLVAAGIYTGDGNRDIDFGGKSILLMSEEGPDFTTIDCQGSELDQHRAFDIHNGEDTTAIIDGFTITGAYWDDGTYTGGAAVFLDSAGMALQNCIITGNSQSGLLIQDCDTMPLRIMNCMFKDNGVFGIQVEGASAKIAGSVIDGNGYIGIFAADWGWGAHSLEISGCVIVNNGNAGLTVMYPMEFHVENSTFYNNRDGMYFEWTPPKKSPEDLVGTSTVSNCLAAYNLRNGFENAFGYSEYEFLCNNSYGNSTLDWAGLDYYDGDAYGNIVANPEFCDTALGNLGVSGSSPCAPTNNNCGVLIGALEAECGLVDVEEEEGPLPYTFELNQNHPNPFNPTTLIEYSVQTLSHVRISIFNVLGQRVRLLVDEVKPAGSYRVSWNGEDENGQQVAADVYLYRFRAGDFVETKKMLLLK